MRRERLSGSDPVQGRALVGRPGNRLDEPELPEPLIRPLRLVVQSYVGGHGPQRKSCKQLRKFIHTQIGLTQNSSQSPTVYLAVIRHNRLCEGSVSTHDDVAAVLPSNGKANLLKSATTSGPETCGSRLIRPRPACRSAQEELAGCCLGAQECTPQSPHEYS
jgi:hypothetical protein